MRRRDFIGALGSSALAWPLHARAQQPGRVRRVGVLMGIAADDPDAQRRYAAFLKQLQQLGWNDGSNVHVDARWGGGNPELLKKYAAELIALGPDVLVAIGSASIQLIRSTGSVPIIFAIIIDPVGAGLVDSLSHPGGNATGFMMFEYNLSGKWLELLKEIMPGVRRAAVVRDPTLPAGIGQFAVIQSTASSIGIEVSAINPSDPTEIEGKLAAFARMPDSGLVVAASPLALVHRELIIALAARYKIPAVYNERSFAVAGGLVAYGAAYIDQYRRAAGYVDRILKGERPADLPVQAPTKYELTINLKTANALGLAVPSSLLARADEVIE